MAGRSASPTSGGWTGDSVFRSQDEHHDDDDDGRQCIVQISTSSLYVLLLRRHRIADRPGRHASQTRQPRTLRTPSIPFFPSPFPPPAAGRRTDTFSLRVADMAVASCARCVALELLCTESYLASALRTEQVGRRVSGEGGLLRRVSAIMLRAFGRMGEAGLG